MNFNETTLRILVRGDYGECYDFYTEKLGLIPVWGDRNGPYTSFAVSEGMPPCFAIFSGDAMSLYNGYVQPKTTIQPDTVVAMIPTYDLDGDYARLKSLGVEFIGEPQTVKEWGMRCVYFRDTEGNLFELSDSNV